jgi:hypothetical protein
MLFEIINNKLEKCTTVWKHKELEIEKLIVSRTSDENPILDEDIFGEELFFIDRQIIDTNKKRSDIIALDRDGNLVVIELKKDEGRLGVEMQALQYLSDMSQFKGEDFINKYYKKKNYDDINQFLNDGKFIKDINQKGRIILIARFFDRALFSMGKWLSDQGVSFKCISYETIKFNEKNLLNFSVIFDQTSSSSQYKLIFSNKNRTPDFFWHNIGGGNNEKWWDFLKQKNQISASFENQPGDRGEEILKNFIKGDKIFAYVSGIGCVGYGEIEDTKYTLIDPDSKDNFFTEHNYHLHRLSIKWKYVVNFKNAISTSFFEKEYGIAHPIQTSSRIKKGNIDALINKLKALSHSA